MAKKRNKANRNKANRNVGGSAFNASASMPFLSTWSKFQKNINAILTGEGAVLKARARDAARNNPTVASYLNIVKDSVVGPNGIVFRSQVKTGKESFNQFDSQRIRDAFAEFQSNMTVDGLDYVQTLNLICETLEVEGEVFIQIVKDRKRYSSGIALKILDNILMSHDYMGTISNGNIVRGSIEYDSYDRPVAYWPWKYDPADELRRGSNARVRIPAEEMLHIFNKRVPNQHRGYSPLTPVLVTLEQANQYIESELVGARVSAATMGFIIPEAGSDTDDLVQPNPETGQYEISLEPGAWITAPSGSKIDKFDPARPTNNFESFIRTLMQICASSLGVTYHSIAGNLDSGSGSAMRFGLIRERETFQSKQKFLQRQFCDRIFKEWFLSASLVHPVISTLPDFRREAYKSSAVWLPKTFEYIDPTRDAAAKIMLYEINAISLQQLITGLGRDYSEVMSEIEFEQRDMESRKISGKMAKLASDILKNDINNP